jgi:polar amino acid transport system substrate-binding protein
METVPPRKPSRRGVRIAALGLLAAVMTSAVATTADANTWDRVRDTRTIKLGYETDARPFSYRDEAGNAAGYAVALCAKIADQVKAELQISELAVQWVPVELDERFRAVEQGSVDLLCGASTVTLSRREHVSFSIPIFPSGIGALVSIRSPVALREVLAQREISARPIWRGSPARTVLERKTFSVIADTTSERWLAERLDTFQLPATVVPVDTYAQGVQRVLDGSSDVFFGDLPILLDASVRSAASGDLILLDRYFTYEPLALALERGDEVFRLLVDRTLSNVFRSDQFRDLFVQWFGPPDESMITFFRRTALPE